LLVTVTCSATGVGVVPGTAAGKLSEECSRATERTGWTSTSTVPDPSPPPPEDEEQDVAAAEEFSGFGVAVEKSAALSSASVQPWAARTRAVVELGAPAGPLPS
jgi:hypothetical protein